MLTIENGALISGISSRHIESPPLRKQFIKFIPAFPLSIPKKSRKKSTNKWNLQKHLNDLILCIRCSKHSLCGARVQKCGKVKICEKIQTLKINRQLVYINLLRSSNSVCGSTKHSVSTGNLVNKIYEKCRWSTNFQCKSSLNGTFSTQ